MLSKRLLLFIIAISILKAGVSQKTSFIVFGSWRITNLLFVTVPQHADAKNILKNCQSCKVIMNDSDFIFDSHRCSLYRTVHNFKITKHYTLTRTFADTSALYADNTISEIFDVHKLTSIDAYKTNYDFNSDEGDVSELEIFVLDKNHIIINQGDNLCYLTRISW